MRSRQVRLAACTAAVAVLASIAAAPATWAARPSGGGGAFSTNCDAVSFGYPREATAVNAPKGTKTVYFEFWQQRSVYDAYMSDPLTYALPPGYADGGTDFNGRDGWWMFDTYPSEVVVAQALDGKGKVLATAFDYCILAG